MNTITATPPTPSDKEKLLALLNEFGIGFKLDGEGPHTVVCSEGDAKVEGYRCFFTAFFFDEKGAFQKMGAWE